MKILKKKAQLGLHELNPLPNPELISKCGNTCQLSALGKCCIVVRGVREKSYKKKPFTNMYGGRADRGLLHGLIAAMSDSHSHIRRQISAGEPQQCVRAGVLKR